MSRLFVGLFPILYAYFLRLILMAISAVPKSIHLGTTIFRIRHPNWHHQMKLLIHHLLYGCMPYSSPLNNTSAFNGILHNISITSHTCIFLHSCRLLISYITGSFHNYKVAVKLTNDKNTPNKKMVKAL